MHECEQFKDKKIQNLEQELHLTERQLNQKTKELNSLQI